MDDFLEDEREEGRDEPRKVLGLGVAIILVLAAAATVVWLVFLKKPAPPAEPQAPAVEEAAVPAVEADAPAAGALLAFPSVPLDGSDAAVREFAAALSSNPEFGRWLLTKDLVRKFVVIADNVANGLSPKPHIDFFAPRGSFRVAQTRQGTVLDESSYGRYDTVAAVAASLDAVAAARLYRAVKPLCQEAYRELGYPGVDFDDTLVRAMAELLGTPVVEGRIALEPKVLSYAMVDERLEGLSAAQKQLLRMGPKSVLVVQSKIREIAAALGVPETRLPRPRTIATGL